MLAALESRISYYLSEGHHVQLGNMGYFSAGLTARPVMDKKEIHAQTIFFGKVHFRDVYKRQVRSGLSESRDVPSVSRMSRTETIHRL